MMFDELVSIHDQYLDAFNAQTNLEYLALLALDKANSHHASMLIASSCGEYSYHHGQYEIHHAEYLRLEGLVKEASVKTDRLKNEENELMIAMRFPKATVDSQSRQ